MKVMEIPLGKYILYSTLWSEGEVLANTSDSHFAIGVDFLNSNIVYVKGLEELVKVKGLHIIGLYDTEQEVKHRDTACYPRRT